MWIETQNLTSDGRPVTKRIKLPGMEEPVEFSSNGKAQVTSDVGELLVAEVDSIVESGESSDSAELHSDDIEQ